MSASSTGLVGRTVMVDVRRGEKTAAEPCEVMACQAAGEYGTYKILVATHDGALLQFGYDSLKLVAREESGGPYR